MESGGCRHVDFIDSCSNGLQHVLQHVQSALLSKGKFAAVRTCESNRRRSTTNTLHRTADCIQQWHDKRGSRWTTDRDVDGSRPTSSTESNGQPFRPTCEQLSAGIRS